MAGILPLAGIFIGCGKGRVLGIIPVSETSDGLALSVDGGGGALE